ncbi:hypothetical protein P5673_009044 [Acropora cervicornis]|uniref:Uncharacterized protein n=1 Tax=Acropora cervicornis TaxID=6130 RepID=A0AAD9QTQ5_ACRCE|nr:hypothetical protein P5673_009044 [Acropora cervicornis]
MDLIDLIGDSRTESLPPGFLRSIKIKYKQESSRVFPPGTPYKTDEVKVSNKTKAKEGEFRRSMSVDSGVSVPSFMAWRVPSRLVQQNRARLLAEGGHNKEREKLGSRASVHTRKSVTSPQVHSFSRGKDELPRLESGISARKSPAQRQTTLPVQTPLPAMKNVSKQQSQDCSLHLAWLLKYNVQCQLITPHSGASILTEMNGISNSKSNKKSPHSHSLQAVESWMKTATHEERELALKFFSTLSGVKTDKLEMLDQKINQDQSEGRCEIGDSGKIEKALHALARSDTVLSRGKLLCNPKRTPDLTKHSFYQKARQRLPVHLRQQYQTWHHLPVYKVSNDAAINKSAMFTQSHKNYGRHFTIHPEWGLHNPVVL